MNTQKLSKKQISHISDAGKKMLWAYASAITWEQNCNRLQYAMLNGKQVTINRFGKQFTMQMDSRNQIVFINLFCGETANVAVDLKGNIVHHKGGMLCC